MDGNNGQGDSVSDAWAGSAAYDDRAKEARASCHYRWYAYVKGVDSDFHPYNSLQAGRRLDK